MQNAVRVQGSSRSEHEIGTPFDGGPQEEGHQASLINTMRDVNLEKIPLILAIELIR